MARGGVGDVVTVPVQLRGDVLPRGGRHPRAEAARPAAAHAVRGGRVGGGEAADRPLVRRLPDARRSPRADRGEGGGPGGAARTSWPPSAPVRRCGGSGGSGG